MSKRRKFQSITGGDYYAVFKELMELYQYIPIKANVCSHLLNCNSLKIEITCFSLKFPIKSSLKQGFSAVYRINVSINVNDSDINVSNTNVNAGNVNAGDINKGDVYTESEDVNSTAVNTATIKITSGRFEPGQNFR